MNLNLLDTPDKLLDTAFGRGRKAAAQYKKQKTAFYTLKGKEIAKIDVSGEYLTERLSKVVKDFPSVDKLPPFYKDLFESILVLDTVKPAISNISSVAKIVKKMRRESIVRMKEMRYEKGKMDEAKKISNQYFGRVSSLVKSLKKSILQYNDAVTKLRELPSIKTDEDVYILAGLPNVGKSTLIGKITASKPKVASFPFTTKGLNVGYFVKKHLPIQVIDTPGLLDRPLFKRNKIELKAISAFQHLHGTIIFVVDASQELNEQKNLLLELKKLFSEKGFMVVINKTDLVTKEEVKKAQDKFSDYVVILEGNGLDNLKEELLQ